MFSCEFSRYCALRSVDSDINEDIKRKLNGHLQQDSFANIFSSLLRKLYKHRWPVYSRSKPKDLISRIIRQKWVKTQKVPGKKWKFGLFTKNRSKHDFCSQQKPSLTQQTLSVVPPQTSIMVNPFWKYFSSWEKTLDFPENFHFLWRFRPKTGRKKITETSE